MPKNPMFSFAHCLRHVFMTGAGYGDLERIEQKDIERWTDYEPPKVGSFATMDRVLEAHADMLDALKQADFWLEGALQCKTWNWDADQHEAASGSLAAIREAIAKAEGRTS